MMATSRLQRILDAECCSGCGLCSVLAPESIIMDYSQAGYLRPHVTGNLPSAADQAIASLCPGMNLALESSVAENHILWGPIMSARTGAATDPQLRHHASSGGVISALLQHLISSGAVQRVIQVAASDVHPTQNLTVISETSEDVWAAAGSRYAPSAPVAALAKIMDMPGQFAFVGKPCDVAAVRAYAARDAAVRNKIPYLISFFCAGVPSVRGARLILERLGISDEETERFRYRGDGWPGYATARTKDGRTQRMTYAESWGSILSHHVQFRCKICPDGSGGFADVVCGDAWDCDAEGYPVFGEGEGRSLVLSRTGRGEALVSDAVHAGRITIEPLAVSEIAKMQPAQARRKQLVLSRIAAMRLLGRPVPSFSGLRLQDAARSISLAARARSFLGLLRRLTSGRSQS